MTTTSPMTQRLDLPAGGRYRLDPDRCELAFRTRHLFGLAVVAGTMQVTSGEILLDRTWPRASVHGHDQRLFLQHRQRPSRRRRAVGKVPARRCLPQAHIPGAGTRQAHGRWMLTGELTVRNVRQPVTLAIESVKRTDDGFQARATTRIDRYAFGVTAARGMAGRFLELSITVTAAPHAPHDPVS